MTAVEVEFLPTATQNRFKKAKPTDLYLAVGYALLPEFRGNGIASRALNKILEYSRETLNAKYVFASANNLNLPSHEVLLRNGFIPIISDDRRTKFFINLRENTK